MRTPTQVQGYSRREALQQMGAGFGTLALSALLAEDASAMYARNVLSFLTPFFDRETKAFAVDCEDEIVKACLIARDGAIVHPSLIDEPAKEEVA